MPPDPDPESPDMPLSAFELSERVEFCGHFLESLLEESLTDAEIEAFFGKEFAEMLRGFDEIPSSD